MEKPVKEKEAEARCRVLPWAQEIVYRASGTLYQVTKSKDLVKLFSKSDHILSYDQILQVETSWAENVLKTLDSDTDSVMPANVVRE